MHAVMYIHRVIAHPYPHTHIHPSAPLHHPPRPLRELREIAKGVTKQLPEPIQEATAKIDEYARGMISGSGSTLFEELGLYYIGPVDGHNLSDLIDVLKGRGLG